MREVWALPLDWPEAAVLPDGAGAIAWFRDHISSAWTALDRPCPERLIDAALTLLDARAARLGAVRPVLVHGDAHNNNLLQTLDGGAFKLIDPDGLRYEPAYDLGVLMREWPETLRADPRTAGLARCRLLSRLSGAPEADIWAWGCLQCVSTGLVLLQIGRAEEGAALLEIGSAWCAEAEG